MNDNKNSDIYNKVCLKCGSLNEADCLFCVKCGTRFDEVTNNTKAELVREENVISNDWEQILIRLKENFKKNVKKSILDYLNIVYDTYYSINLRLQEVRTEKENLLNNTEDAIIEKAVKLIMIFCIINGFVGYFLLNFFGIILGVVFTIIIGLVITGQILKKKNPQSDENIDPEKAKEELEAKLKELSDKENMILKELDKFLESPLIILNYFLSDKNNNNECNLSKEEKITYLNYFTKEGIDTVKKKLDKCSDPYICVIGESEVIGILKKVYYDLHMPAFGLTLGGEKLKYSGKKLLYLKKRALFEYKKLEFIRVLSIKYLSKKSHIFGENNTYINCSNNYMTRREYGNLLNDAYKEIRIIFREFLLQEAKKLLNTEIIPAGIMELFEILDKREEMISSTAYSISSKKNKIEISETEVEETITEFAEIADYYFETYMDILIFLNIISEDVVSENDDNIKKSKSLYSELRDNPSLLSNEEKYNIIKECIKLNPGNFIFYDDYVTYAFGIHYNIESEEDLPKELIRILKKLEIYDTEHINTIIKLSDKYNNIDFKPLEFSEFC